MVYLPSLEILNQEGVRQVPDTQSFKSLGIETPRGTSHCRRQSWKQRSSSCPQHLTQGLARRRGAGIVSRTNDEAPSRLLPGHAGWQRLHATAELTFGFTTSNSTFPSALQQLCWVLKRKWSQGFDMWQF